MSAPDLVIPRRAFLRGLNLSLGGLAVGYCLPALAQEATNEPGKSASPKPSAASQATESKAPGLNPNLFVHVAALLQILETRTRRSSEETPDT